jgi:outer membrane protein TolC
MLEAEEEARLQERFVRIARRRLEINQFLQEKGQADEAKLEAVRSAFFSAQDRLFSNQRTYITRQAQLRRLMGYVE